MPAQGTAFRELVHAEGLAASQIKACRSVSWLERLPATAGLFSVTLVLLACAPWPRTAGQRRFVQVAAAAATVVPVAVQ